MTATKDFEKGQTSPASSYRSGITDKDSTNTSQDWSTTASTALAASISTSPDNESEQTRPPFPFKECLLILQTITCMSVFLTGLYFELRGYTEGWRGDFATTATKWWPYASYLHAMACCNIRPSARDNETAEQYVERTSRLSAMGMITSVVGMIGFWGWNCN
jgi:hypothetical protein